jgi:hypothetical protein
LGFSAELEFCLLSVFTPHSLKIQLENGTGAGKNGNAMKAEKSPIRHWL